MLTKSKIYGVIVPLLEDVRGVECWNFTDRSKHDLAAGTLVTADNVNDATHTTVCVRDKDGNAPGILLTWDNGQKQMGYRFIIPNKVLRKATGLRVPFRTDDLVGDIIAYESGELTEAESKGLLQRLKKKGMLSGLQGHYSRAAKMLGV